MLLGVLDSGTSVGTVYNPPVSSKLFGEYIQDDWRVTHRLTANLGLRYEMQTPDTYRHDVASTFDPNALNPISSMVGKPILGALEFLGPGHRDVYNPNYTNIAPRFGFSYQPLARAVVHGGYGIFFPESVTCCSPGQPSGFSATTYINPSLNGGVTPNPNIGTSNPWGGVYAQITGNKNGGFQQDGNGIGSVFTSRPSPYVQQWMFGVQYAITPKDELEVDYIGNRGVRMIGSPNYNQLNPSYLPLGPNFLGAAASSNPFAAPLQSLEAGGAIAPSTCNLDNAGATNAQLMSPYPQYCGVGQTDAPVGQSLYNSMQVTFNHRVSKGLTALVSYTYSKFLDNVEGNNSWSYNGPSNWGLNTANSYNLAGDKSVDGGDIPQSLVASYSYQLPIGRGKTVGSGMSRVADAIVGGWEVSGIATFKAGIPLGIIGNDQPSYGGNPRPDVVGNPKLAKPTLHEWFNTGAFPRFSESATLDRSLLASRPQPPCMRSELGFALLRHRDSAAAAAEFSAERAANPECGLALLGLARLAIDSGENQQAIELLTELWGRDLGFFQSNAGIILEGLSTERDGAFAVILAQENTVLPADLRHTLLAIFNGTEPETSEFAVESTSVDPSAASPATARQTAEEYYAAGQFQQCARRLDLSLVARNAGKVRLLAACSFFAGDYERASAAAVALAALQPHSPEALYWSIQANERLAL
jgi:hypothetical protein